MKVSKKYWRNKILNNTNSCPNVSLFRFLGSLDFVIKSKNILEIGFGLGSDLIEFKKRGALTYGIDINKHFVDNLKKKIKNLRCIDCTKKNLGFKNIKFDLIIHRDLIYYLDNKEINSIHQNIYSSLKKNGLYVFQYVENDFIKLNKNFDNDNFDLNIIKNYKKKKFAEKDNPVRYLKHKFLMQSCLKNNFTVFGKKILIESYDKNESKIRFNRYIAFRK